MLQSPVWSQLARLKCPQTNIGKRMIMKPNTLGPLKTTLNAAKDELKLIGEDEKHVFCGGTRSIAMAVEMLRQKKIIAVPTDTIYGLAGLAADKDSIKKIYEIKDRDNRKPLAICLSNVKNICMYGTVDHLPPGLLETLVPGPFTLVLKRTKIVNPDLNPGIDNIGIRVPDFHFIRSVAHLAGPLVLTSANKSNTISTIHPEEFSDLWPELGGIFYHALPRGKQRHGSTIVDLSVPGHYTILRYGVAWRYLKNTLNKRGLTALYSMTQDAGPESYNVTIHKECIN